LMCAVLRVERTLNICNLSERNLMSFPFLHCLLCLPALH
jgi:hypothetical protein